MKSPPPWIGIVCVFFLFSCSSLPLVMITGRAWIPPSAPTPTSIELSYPEVDHQTAATSLEAELSRLTPLLFMEHGLPLAGGPSGRDKSAVPCVAEVRAVEREYMAGWKTQRSTSLELVLKRLPETEDGEKRVIAASCARAQGNVSLSSSRDLHRLLDKAIGKLAEALEKASEEK